MFKSFVDLLEKAAFWFLFICVACLTYSVLMAFFFGTLPGQFLAFLDTMAVIWCFFAGTLPLLYLGFSKIKTYLENKFIPLP